MRPTIVFIGGALCGLIIAGASCSPRGQASPAKQAHLPFSVDWTKARSAPVQELVTLAYVPVGEAFVEVARPGPPFPISESSSPPSALSFATRPRHAGDYGLCKATVVSVAINQELGEADRLITAETFYKVVDDTGNNARGRWTDRYERRLAQLCSRAGRVLWSYDDPAAESFFDADISKSSGLRFGVRAVQMAIAQAKALPSSVSCADNDSLRELDCAQPAKNLASLDMRRLSHIDMAPCISRPDWHCIDAEFQGNWRVILQAHIPEMHNDSDVLSVDQVQISLHMAIS